MNALLTALYYKCPNRTARKACAKARKENMKNPFNQALKKAKAELKTRYVTANVTMRTMEIYLEAKRKGLL